MVSPAPVNVAVDTEDSGPARPNKIWVGWFQQVVAALNQAMSYAASTVLVEPTGFSITLGAKLTTLTPAGTLATGTVKMPASPIDGQPVQVSTTQTITALTVVPNTGQTIKNAPTTLAAGTSFLYYYNAAETTWYRLS